MSLVLLLCAVSALAADADFQKAHVRRVHVGYVIPPPPDSGEMNNDKDKDKDKEEHESAQPEKYEHSAFVFLQIGQKNTVMQIFCGDHCMELKKKLEASPDVEIRTENKKMWLKTADQTLTGKVFTSKVAPATQKPAQ